MSHDGSWRAAGLITIRNPPLHFRTHKVARGVTDVGVGSGALLGGSTETPDACGRQAIEESKIRGFIDQWERRLCVREAWSMGRGGGELLLNKLPAAWHP
jgi:hypothetical protein